MVSPILLHSSAFEWIFLALHLAALVTLNPVFTPLAVSFLRGVVLTGFLQFLSESTLLRFLGDVSEQMYQSGGAKMC